MIVVLKLLPFLIDTVKDHEHYQIILQLIEIVQILFAPVIGLQTISRLKTLIEQHLKHMKNLFPDYPKAALFDSCSITDKIPGTNGPSHVHEI